MAIPTNFNSGTQSQSRHKRTNCNERLLQSVQLRRQVLKRLFARKAALQTKTAATQRALAQALALLRANGVTLPPTLATSSFNTPTASTNSTPVATLAPTATTTTPTATTTTLTATTTTPPQ